MILILYLIDFLEKASFLCGVGLAVSALILMIAGGTAVVESHYALWNVIKNKGFIPLFLSVALVLIPSKTTLYLMASAKFMESIVSNEKTKEFSDKTVKILEKKLDELLKENIGSK